MEIGCGERICQHLVTETTETQKHAIPSAPDKTFFKWTFRENATPLFQGKCTPPPLHPQEVDFSQIAPYLRPLF